MLYSTGGAEEESVQAEAVMDIDQTQGSWQAEGWRITIIERAILWLGGSLDLPSLMAAMVDSVIELLLVGKSSSIRPASPVSCW